MAYLIIFNFLFLLLAFVILMVSLSIVLFVKDGNAASRNGTRRNRTITVLFIIGIALLLFLGLFIMSFSGLLHGSY